MDARAEFATAKGDLAADEWSNFYIAHIGGNNVSGSRPFPGRQAEFEADYDGLIADITAADTFLPLPLTKRLYGKDSGYTEENSVDPDDDATEVNGSLPYNEAIIHPRIAALMPDWVDGNGVPYVDPYALADRFPDLTNNDGIHGYGAAIARYILAKTAGRALGIAADTSRAGKSIVYTNRGSDFQGPGDPKNFTWNAARNLFGTISGSVTQNHPWFWGASNTDGTFDPHILLYPGGQYQNRTEIPDDANAFARVSDTRFHTSDHLKGLYVQGSQVYTLTWEDLTPGDILTVNAMGLRNAGGTNRRGALTLMAGASVETLELNAASDAISNQVTFTQVAVPPSGLVSLSLAVADGAAYGYLHGVILEFS